jgi:hypothetical protein
VGAPGAGTSAHKPSRLVVPGSMLHHCLGVVVFIVATFESQSGQRCCISLGP